MAVLHFVDYILFVLSLVISMGVGIYHAWQLHKKKKNEKMKKADLEMKEADEFLVGGRDMPIFPVALSVLTSVVSGISLLAIPADIYYRGRNRYVKTIRLCTLKQTRTLK